MKLSYQKLRVALVAGLLLAGGVVAYAGMWTGLPIATSSPTTASGNAATLPLTGNEVSAFDTLLSGGRNPQTETISVDQLKTYMYGNGGTSGATAITQVNASSGAVTCSASICLINSEALTTAASGFYTLTITNTNVLSTSAILASVGNISNTSTGTSLRTVSNTSAGVVTVVVKNEGGVTFNGTIRLKVVVIN